MSCNCIIHISFHLMYISHIMDAIIIFHDNYHCYHYYYVFRKTILSCVITIFINGQ